MDKILEIKEQGFKIKGHVKFTLMDAETKEVLEVKEIDNLVVNGGLQLFLDHMAEDIPGESATTGATYLWVGSGTTAELITDTALDSYESELALDSYSRSGQAGVYSVQFTTGDSNHDWSEVGLANGTQGGGGTLITRTTFTKFTKDNSFTIRVDYTITLVNQ